jgi:RNA polymerase sigma-70 factor (ECF subfamily)
MKRLMAPGQLASAHDAAGDDALMRRVAVRDAEAFRQLVERHAARPYRVAWRMLGDEMEAQDVAQEAMLRLWRDAAGWRSGGAGVSAWLTRVATNLCLDRLRVRGRISGEEVPERADQAPLADALIESGQERVAVIAAMQALPESQRAAIVLTYYEELSNADAASIMEMNIKAFESLLLRARRALRQMLVEVAGG